MQVHAAAGCCGHGDTDSAVCMELTLAISANIAALSGLKPRDTSRAQIAIGIRSLQRLREAAEAECDQQHLDALVGRDGDGVSEQFRSRRNAQKCGRATLP